MDEITVTIELQKNPDETMRYTRTFCASEDTFKQLMTYITNIKPKFSGEFTQNE